MHMICYACLHASPPLAALPGPAVQVPVEMERRVPKRWHKVCVGGLMRGGG